MKEIAIELRLFFRKGIAAVNGLGAVESPSHFKCKDMVIKDAPFLGEAFAVPDRLTFQNWDKATLLEAVCDPKFGSFPMLLVRILARGFSF